jgi:aerotaxis receptor
MTQVGSNIIEVQGGASEIGMASSRVFTVAQSFSVESQRLKADVATFLN